jgi:CheY-like chemotaxis protein
MKIFCNKSGAKAMKMPMIFQFRKPMNRRILVADDECSIREASSKVLRAKESDAMTPIPTNKPNPAQTLTRDAPCPVSTTDTMKKRILIVDDDLQIRESLRKLLRAEGYEVVLATSGQEGFDKFDQENTDLLLLDLNLPGCSGWDVFGTITSLNPFLPIIIITGRDNQRELAAGAGVGALMEKPLDVPVLLQTITGLLAESAEKRLRRLVGLDGQVRYAPPRPC